MLHVERGRFLNLILSFFDISDRTFFLKFRERQLNGLNVVFLKFPFNDGVVVPINEGIFRLLVLNDAHLGIHIILHAVLITVQMVGCNIHENSDIGTEVIHVV